MATLSVIILAIKLRCILKNNKNYKNAIIAVPGEVWGSKITKFNKMATFEMLTYVAKTFVTK